MGRQALSSWALDCSVVYSLGASCNLKKDMDVGTKDIILNWRDLLVPIQMPPPPPGHANETRPCFPSMADMKTKVLDAMVEAKRPPQKKLKTKADRLAEYFTATLYEVEDHYEGRVPGLRVARPGPTTQDPEIPRFVREKVVKRASPAVSVCSPVLGVI